MLAKNYVFLKLGSELASDATPKIDIVQGEKVEDMAGNETFGREVDEFEANDGISPRLTVTLSGGSGSGTGNEGPDKLTKDQITVTSRPTRRCRVRREIAVVCSSLTMERRAEEDGNSIEVARKRDRQSARHRRLRSEPQRLVRHQAFGGIVNDEVRRRQHGSCR